MPLTEIAFEQFLAAHETTRGTQITTPTHLIHQGGMVKPTKSVRIAEDFRGELFANYRSAVTRRGLTWETRSEDADVNTLPWWLNIFVKGGVTSPTTPGGATNSRLWTFTRTGSSDDLRSFTGWWGDPAIQVWRNGFCMGQEMTISCDATAEDGVVKAKFKGIGQPWATVADPTVPAAIAGNLMPAQFLQCWIDTSSAIGTTAITGRVLGCEHTIRTGVTDKYMGGGPTAGLGFSDVGRQAVSAVTTTLRLEMPDLTQYTLWENHSTIKLRMRYNGPLIESTFYEYLEIDCYGPFDALDWGENAASNRVLQLTINGFKDSTLGSDLSVKVQNARTAL